MTVSSKEAFEFWKDIASHSPSRLSVKLNPSNDLTGLDARFLSGFIIDNYDNGCCRLLDLGSGTGLTLEKINVPVKLITAVEPFEEFSQHIARRQKLEIINETIQNFVPNREYDLITMFGLMQYFDEREAEQIYKKYSEYLAPLGSIIVKNQFGVSRDVNINGYSEQIGKNYYSQYRTLDHEKAILARSGLVNFVSHDIYPKEYNRWSDTHYYVIVAKKTHDI